MARKVISRRIKGDDYGVIQRGASFTIPVEIKDERDNPIDLTGHTVEFTVKKVKTDFDRHDDFAYITKHFLPQDPVNGKFYITLSSDDTDFEPGEFFFDIELVNDENGMIFRLVTLSFTLDGGPTNRRINKGMGQWPTGETITVITLAEGDPIIVIAPTMNLDGDVFGQLAVLMEAVENCEKHVAECDADREQLEEELKEAKEKIAELQEAQGASGDDIDEILENQEKVTETLEKQVEINAELMETLEHQGEMIHELHLMWPGIERRLLAYEAAIAELYLKYGRVWRYDDPQAPTD